MPSNLLEPSSKTSNLKFPSRILAIQRPHFTNYGADTANEQLLMPPISIHKDAPIAPATATKADRSTAVADSSSFPPTRTTPAYTPATTTQSSSDPPPPQPGARPVALASTMRSNHHANQSKPQPGAVPTATFVTTETHLAALPPQFTRPPPSDSQLTGHSTATSTVPSKTGPTTLNYGPAAPSPFQAEDSGATIPTADAFVRRPSLEHPPGYVQAPDNAPHTAEGGTGAPGITSGGVDNSEGVGAAAWNMLSKAGEALKKGEEAAWRAVRNK